MLSPLVFTHPILLSALLLLPVLWWLLRLTPPKPVEEVFPPVQILKELDDKAEISTSSPWWLTLLRLLLAAFIIFALADPIWKPSKQVLTGEGRLLMVVDNSWAASRDWDKRVDTLKSILNEARDNQRPVSIIFTNIEEPNDIAAQSADEAEKRLAAISLQPIAADYKKLTQVVLDDTQTPPTTLVYLSSGIQQQGDEAFIDALAKYKAPQRLRYQSAIDDLLIITKAENNADEFLIQVQRPINVDFQSAQLIALDKQGRKLGTTEFEFDEDDYRVNVQLKLPVELRNEVARLEIGNLSTAGSTYLIDESFQRRRIGLISGQNNDLAQPLLSPLYYIKRALAPFSDLIDANNANLVEAVPQIISQNPSVIVMADVGSLPVSVADEINQWVNGGGTLVRFAGSHLAAAANDDRLLPVKLRQGERKLSGSLTWGELQPLAKFHKASPFEGILVPQDVSVKRQVLAEPDLGLDDLTWASLEDGTPLVTAKNKGRGRIILFHVTADASWSNLPLSGSFVGMLRKITANAKTFKSNGQDLGGDALKPYQILNANGAMIVPPPNVKPLSLAAQLNAAKQQVVDSFDNPPGLYGASDAFVARNLFAGSATIRPVGNQVVSFFNDTRGFINEVPFTLKPWLLTLAAVLFILDCLAMIWIRGHLNFNGFKTKTVKLGLGLVLIIAFSHFAPFEGFAQEQKPALLNDEFSINYDGALKTKLAYVKTGNLDLDDISNQGLIGLTAAITERTALEPGNPIGVDLAKDELSFYPLIYWPIEAGSAVPSPETMARVDAYMKQGGTVLFDTRDALANVGITGTSPESLQLQRILQGLDVPPLEAVSQNHVLTRTFYLLDSFPGLYSDGQLWVKALPKAEEGKEQLTNVGDGVSSIIITSNDFASAWAVDDSGRFIFPTVPPSFEQRTYAFRTGINIVMYTLTGNYKADQVHIPALLKRLGQ